MTSILATDYGNLSAFLFGLPTLLVAMVVLGFGIGYRSRRTCILSGVISLVVGVQFFFSVPNAKRGDGGLTQIFGATGLGFALIALFISYVVAPPALALGTERKTYPNRRIKFLVLIACLILHGAAVETVRLVAEVSALESFEGSNFGINGHKGRLFEIACLLRKSIHRDEAIRLLRDQDPEVARFGMVLLSYDFKANCDQMQPMLC